MSDQYPVTVSKPRKPFLGGLTEEEIEESILPLPTVGTPRLFRFGGPGSGHFDHEGRPGMVGGSSKDGGSMNKLADSIVYRSTTSTRKEGLPGKHFAAKEEIAKQYGGSIEHYKISSDANIVDFSSEEAQPVTSLWGNATDKEIRDKAKELGIHGINYDFDPSGKFGIVIFDETKIKKVK